MMIFKLEFARVRPHQMLGKTTERSALPYKLVRFSAQHDLVATLTQNMEKEGRESKDVNICFFGYALIFSIHTYHVLFFEKR